ncbi:glutathione S-transferase N-terminal domain-containing protein [Cyanobium sp. LEGE 06143]|uniref:glutathione S-transferase family protein n=1 Tax=Cyanobium sp. LEGE 06143 TaxID=945727 RepID=UPI0018800020|nr:glutathione binding-like protein [Cyanobium sp. LEGE 06143]MBE9172915.1 glutathione S-transferase N-terminal domain-containing protein [Cyanobium sp. LEGE 06143]
MGSEIHLYTASTMNGWKPVIFLEEAEIEYDITPIDFSKKEQKSEWYLKLNPNGRIPTIVDHGNSDFVVFESGAILWYLAEKYQKFLPCGQKAHSEALQWLMFQMAGVGPMMGQAMYFQRIAVPKGIRNDDAIDRYVSESRRLLEVLDRQLAGKAYLLGDEFTIVDMATYPWAMSFPWAKVSIQGLEHLQAWFDRMDARPATQKAITIPKPFPAFFGQGDEAASQAENASRFND